MTQARHTFTDEQWSRVSAALPARKGRPGLDDRAFLSGVLWIAKTGAPWRDLPGRYGHWAVVYQRYARWCRAGIFEAVFKALQEPDLEEVQIDSTHCRAHQAGLGAQKKNGPQSIGLSVGGLSTKIHSVCDALGNPLKFILTAGQKNDRPQAEPLVDGLEARAVLADKGYDSDTLADWLREQGAEVVIPSRKTAKKARVFDRHKYKSRHLIENLFQKMKRFRRVAFRFDKLDVMFMGFAHFVGALIWLA